MGRNSKAALEWGHLLLMIALAAYFRLPGLGTLSLYGDEDYSAFAVQTILLDGLPSMPSGLPYWRGAPYSYLAAASAYLFNLNEFSLRFPSAIAGILTIPVFYGLARRLIGIFPGSLATWLLVFSAWHIDMSREGRMYSMFLAFFLLSLFCFQKGFIEGQKALRIVAVFLAALTLTLHELSILLVVLWCIPALIQWSSEKLRDSLSVFGAALGLSALWLGYQKFETFVIPGSMEVANRHGWLSILTWLSAIQFTPKFWMLSCILERHAMLFGLLVLTAASLFLWAWKTSPTELRQNRYLAVGSAIVLILATFNLFGLIALTLLLLFLWGREKNTQLLGTGYCRWIIGEVGAIFFFWAFYGLMLWKGDGLSVASEIDLVRKIVKDSLYYPALHILPYFEAFPVMTAMVVLGSLTWRFLGQEDEVTRKFEAILLAWFWFPLLLLGFKTEWIALRHTVMLYPFYLMIFAWTIHRGLRWVQTRISVILTKGNVASEGYGYAVVQLVILPVVLVLIPIISEQHSVRAAIRTGHLSYGEYISPLLHGFAFHPDHKSPGEYVKGNLKNNDVVIAMDVFQQRHYIGQVDYWLTSVSAKTTYAYQQGDVWYDIYTRTPVITSEEELERLISGSSRNIHRVWLVTSGELADRLSSSFPPELIKFIQVHDSNLVFVGRDNRTSVYRFDITT